MVKKSKKPKAKTTAKACARCGKKAVVELEYTRQNFCKTCFIRLFERRVWKANREFRLFKRGDRVVVGVSGGKDSSAMMFVLSKIAIGHNLDDVAQTFLMNILRGEPQRNERFGVSSAGLEDEAKLMRVVPRVRPLVFNTEKETVRYCLLNGILFLSCKCPYSVEALRGDVKGFLDAVEKKCPGTKFNLLYAFAFGKESVARKNTVSCGKCGSPSSKGLCKACELKQLLGN